MLFRKMVRKDKTLAVDSAPAAADPTNPALMNATQQAHFRAAQAMHFHQQRQVWYGAFGDQAALQGAAGGGDGMQAYGHIINKKHENLSADHMEDSCIFTRCG